MIEKTTQQRIIFDALYTIAGILFCCFALKGFLVPNHFFDGGVTGISLLIHEVYHWNIGFVILLANIPFIVIGAFQVNKTFAIKTFLALRVWRFACILFRIHKLPPINF